MKAGESSGLQSIDAHFIEERSNQMDRVYVMQLVRSFQVGELKRRDFLKKTTAALGSVAAANMLLAA